MERTKKTPKETTKAARLIGHMKGKQKGPTLVFFGGIHGNEPSGVTAIQQVFRKLKLSSFKINGAVYGIRGNIPAQLKGKRYLDSDLNRLWTTPQIEGIKNKKALGRTVEEKELIALHLLISDILAIQSPPFYFVDFHTTSSKTPPFITINDALINRRFSRLFPVPIILGIEEYLEGPLLSYINEKGYVSLGFESGQHTDENAVKNSIAFMWLAMVYSGLLKKSDVLEFHAHYQQLQSSAQGDASFYEVMYRHSIAAKDSFQMLTGFKSFAKVGKGTVLAKHNQEPIQAKKDAVIFMPLYQKQGEEGFFLIRKIPVFALWLSTSLRKMKLDAMLTLLPGVSWSNAQKETLLVNVKTARFFTKPFFHLLGYRNRTLDKGHILMNNRERTAKNRMYKDTWWFGKKKTPV